MKTVGILTFHYPINYGGILQAYALRRKINEFDGYSAEIINYVIKGFRYAPYIPGKDGQEQFRKKVSLFADFLWDHCGVRHPAIEHVEGNDYDYYCVGSDQLWNPIWKNEEVLLKYLDEDAVRFSYGTSIGMDMEAVKDYDKWFQEPLSKFKEISVREKVHTDFISEITGKKCQHVVDPTLLLEEDQYDDIIPKEPLRKGEYILLYTIATYDEMINYKAMELANTLSRKYGLPIVHTAVFTQGNMINNNAGCIMHEGVENFLWYIKNASIVVTNSYHGTVLSMRFERPFYAFHNTRMKTRTEHLIETYDVGDRFITGYKTLGELTKGMDYEAINEKLRAEKEKSLDFLRTALDIS